MTQRTTAPPQTAPRNPNRGDAIDSWLGVFTRFLRLPSEQTRSIRDELDSHIRERVRDLMLAGLNEDEGVRRAIDELGEAAELAAHFRAAHRPNRRMLMSIAAIGVAAGAAVISVVALTQAQPAAKPPEAGAVQAGGVKAINGVPVLRDIPVLGTVFVPRSAVTDSTLLSTSAQPAQARFSLTLSGTTLRKAAEAIAQEQGKRLSLRTGSVMDPERSIDSLQLVDVDLCSAVRQLNEALGLIGENRIDFRVRGDAMDVAPIRDFDKAETTLIAYDLSDALRCNAKSEELVETVIQFVEPEGWRENGGETARLKVVGTKMFVEAPPRFHERVAWILDQFSGKATRHANEIRALEAAMKAEAAKVAVDRDRALEKARDEADRVNAHRAAAEAKFKADQADAQRLETIRRQADEAALKATDKSGEPARNSPTQPSDPVAPGGRPGSNVNPGGSPFDAPKLPASTPGAPGGEAPAVPARLPGSSAA